MLFLNKLSLQFNTTFLALNKSREACSIEIFISNVSKFQDMLLHCIIILKRDSTKRFFQRSKQVEIT